MKSVPQVAHLLVGLNLWEQRSNREREREECVRVVAKPARRGEEPTHPFVDLLEGLDLVPADPQLLVVGRVVRVQQLGVGLEVVEREEAGAVRVERVEGEDGHLLLREEAQRARGVHEVGKVDLLEVRRSAHVEQAHAVEVQDVLVADHAVKRGLVEVAAAAGVVRLELRGGGGEGVAGAGRLG